MVIETSLMLGFMDFGFMDFVLIDFLISLIRGYYFGNDLRQLYFY